MNDVSPLQQALLHRIVKVTALPQYRLQVQFGDGVSGIVEIFPRLSGPIFEPLRDEVMFRRVTIDEETGAVCWPNGPDLAPDAMYSRLSGRPIFPDRQKSAASAGASVERSAAEE